MAESEEIDLPSDEAWALQRKYEKQLTEFFFLLVSISVVVVSLLLEHNTAGWFPLSEKEKYLASES